ncbi:DUF2779 domain-containing protein [Litoribaculum gwangyangense]|uniref:DUF2779 domain-containing protein n=1 Tax=Litoribaculum gwangyangense TaxID=1130722 RepID=A0ABP9BXH8_9FLAO
MRALTKSRYKLGLECPNKLYYTNKNEYANTKQDNSFLEALASGGFQVEELAKLHYPEGVLIEDKKSDGAYDYKDKVEETNKLLQNENVVIFEAAFQFENLFIRVDILEKKGNQINLIEVKSKSFQQGNPKKEVKFNTDWKFYLFDVAFQKYVIEKAFPDFIVTPFLKLADKDKTTTIDGLNQLFRVSKASDNRTGIEAKISKLDNPEKESVLSKVDVSDIIQRIESSEYRILNEFTFENSIQVLAKAYEEDRFFNYDLNFQICKHCEFKTDGNTQGLKSGFKECFSKKLGWKEDDFKDPNVFEIWDFRRWPKLNETVKIKLTEIEDGEFGEIKGASGKMARVERQLIQKHKALENDFEPEVLKELLKAEMVSWKFPLNFIDFETSTVALPFYSGQKPYEQIAFQFSHHIYHEDGRIEHANQYINLNPGEFPNFEFVRALRLVLEQNEGSIFRFSHHENTVLCQILRQIYNSNIEDKDDLFVFIQQITHATNNPEFFSWTGYRDMIDLCQVIKDYYYNPHTKGSNSIKAVLPAVFESSELIRNKYSQPIGAIGINSHNFTPDKVWLNIENGKVVDPYKSLGKPFDNWDDNFERVSDIEDINDGGAAMTAYGLAQYTDMSDMERENIKKALLKYCELDTLAMVMIYEHLNELTRN